MMLGGGWPALLLVLSDLRGLAGGAGVSVLPENVTPLYHPDLWD